MCQVIPPIPRIILLVGLAGAFVHFLYAGGRTFTISQNDDAGAGWAQVSFIVTGTLAVGVLGARTLIRPLNGVASALILACSLALYEWARHVIFGRGFSIAWSERVPDSVCNVGPYRYVRHPIYGSYVLAFLAAFVAMPSAMMLAVLLFNVGLWAHAARSDERDLEQSALAADYTDYKRAVGILFPRLTGSSPRGRH